MLNLILISRQTPFHLIRSITVVVSSFSTTNVNFKDFDDEKANYAFLLRSNKQFENRKAFEICIKNYEKIFDLVSKSNKTCLQPNLLAFMPSASAKLRTEEKFVERCLKNWWTEFEPISWEYTRFLTHTIQGLRHIDENTSGKVFNSVGLEPYEKLTRLAFTDSQNLIARYIRMILTSLVIVQEKSHKNFSPEFLSHLTDKLIKFFDDANKGRIRFPEDTVQQVHFLLDTMNQLGIQYLPDACLKDIVEIFSKNFDIWFKYPLRKESEEEDLRRLGSCHTVSRIFLKWNVDADKYVKDFWSTMFSELSENLKILAQRQNRFRAQILIYCLFVAVQFDKEQSFMDNKKVFWTHIKYNFPLLNGEELDEIYTKILTKYASKPELMDQLISREIINKIFKNRKSK